MRLHKTYEKTLPQGYKEIFSIDAKDKKTSLIMTISSLVVMLSIVLIAFLIIRPFESQEIVGLIKLSFFALTLVAYLVFHEIIHGICYKILTGEKLTFGLTLTVAYCGVPNIYVYRKPAIIAVISPFIIFTILFITSFFFLTNTWNLFFAILVFAVHVGGCVGDLFVTGIYLFKLKDNKILLKDDGPKQTFYQLIEE
jgi:hypothetical protein